MSHVYEKATIHILDWLHHAERDLIGVSVQTFAGTKGRVQNVRLDDHHGLCFTFGAEKWYPVSAIKERS
jgi:hypothetical protein